MRRQPTSLRPCDGFTLLEFLVALTILALMLGITMNSLNFSVQTSNSVENSIRVTEELHLAQRALRRQIQRAVPMLRETLSGPDQLDFEGGAKAIEFVAPLHGLSWAAGLHRIRFQIEDDVGFGGNSSRLVMYYARNAAAGPDWTEAGGAVVVLDGFTAAEFDYSSATAPAGVEWLREWRDPMRLPGLVRLRVEYASGSEQVMAPDMLVAIRSTSRSRMSRRGAG
jgi:general secretion pathway protein J